MSIAPTGNFSAGGLGIIKGCTQGLARTRIVHYANAPVLDNNN